MELNQIEFIGKRYNLGDILVFDALEYEKSLQSQGKLNYNFIHTKEWFEKDLAEKNVFGEYVIYGIVRSVPSQSTEGDYLYDRVHLGRLDEDKRIIFANTNHLFRTDTVYDMANKILRNVDINGFELYYFDSIISPEN